MNYKTIIISAIIVVIVGTAAFFAGMQYGKNTGRNVGQYQRLRLLRHGTARNAKKIPVRGQIISTANGTITVKLPDGESKIIVLSGTTKITKLASGSASDLKDGEKVMVIGTSNSDGSVTAKTLQLNP